MLNFSPDVIQRQMAHAIGEKVRQAYDRAQFMKERKKFMVAWCDALVEQGRARFNHIKKDRVSKVLLPYGVNILRRFTI